MHSTRPRALVLMTVSSRIMLPPVPENLKKGAKFGYIIDEAFQRNVYMGRGTAGAMKDKDYKSESMKKSMMRNAYQKGYAPDPIKCVPAIVPFQTPKGERALFASFASYPPRGKRPLPSPNELAKFKHALFVQEDPQWHAYR